MKKSDTNELVKSTFWALRETHEAFQDHCEAVGVPLWRGFSEAVELWVKKTQKDRRLTLKK